MYLKHFVLLRFCWKNFELEIGFYVKNLVMSCTLVNSIVPLLTMMFPFHLSSQLDLFQVC
jgi:hypothetical protein